jgi:hypothetical protein
MPSREYHIKPKYGKEVVKDILSDTRIKHKDYFWCKYLYMMTHEWFIEHHYGPRDDKSWPEKLYLHRFYQDGSEEVWIWWRFRKQFNQFFRYDLDVDWHIVAMSAAEIVKDGKKYKANKGDAEFKIYAKLIFTKQKDFSKGILSYVRDTFLERMYYKDILQHRKQLYYEVNEFKQALRTYFNLPNWLPEAEGHKFWLDENMNTPFFDPGEKK